MQKAAKTSRLLTVPSFNAGLAGPERLVGQSGLLQQIVLGRFTRIANSQQIYVEIANRLIRAAEHAYSFRDADTIEEAGEVLMSLPVDNARQAGLYYHALALKRKGRIEEAETALEAVADRAPLVCRARAIQTLGESYREKGQLDEALRYQLEVLRVASDENAHSLLITLLAHYQISHIRSITGDHQDALAILENLWPLVRVVAIDNPLYYYGYHNELAIELAELGRLAEAGAACKIALASPFAPAYPEWAETRDEIEAKRTAATPSIVAINSSPDSVPSADSQTERSSKPDVMPTIDRLTGINPFSISVTDLPDVACATLDRLGRIIKIRAPPSPFIIQT
jgi:tetratricopeptide (TPR) repeat protein